MALATANITKAHGGLGARFASLLETLQTRTARRKVYRETYRELASLSNRDLADLGLARSEIGRIAWQAANEI
ncbi:DUF1127 domain-containing protein [Antarctobacter heliothermus]|uniref:YjiS-like domain-containing protein n=1 Tax=Antarctobacter heliothermus TaxID=74033 RepID=A0A239LNZ4_9RHOB|nr:DUF1127 domain-containing protein [Antarctobacter heliothermus]SNT32171.1 protein of unknown function [Antarctobacter heliothermus]